MEDIAISGFRIDTTQTDRSVLKIQGARGDINEIVLSCSDMATLGSFITNTAVAGTATGTVSISGRWNI
jgi:hypothetical protein